MAEMIIDREEDDERRGQEHTGLLSVQVEHSG